MSAINRTLLLSIVLTLIGCQAPERASLWPEPRPLGAEFATPESPSGTGPPVAAQARRETGKPAPGQATGPTQGRPGPLSLRDAIALALMGNPHFRASSWEVRAAEARRLQASLLPNPEVGVEVEEIEGDRHGLRESEQVYSVGQLIQLGGKRAKRTRVAEFERQVAGWEYEAQRLDVLTDVAEAFVAVLGAQRKVELTEETVRIAKEGLKAASDRVEAGAASPVERTRAQVALSSARTQLQRERHGLEAARIGLVGTWGSYEPRFARVVGELNVDVALPSLGDLNRRLSQNPEIMRAAVAMTQRRAELKLAKAQRIPDLTVEAGYQRFEEDHTDAFLAAVSLPLPIFDRNQGGIREARANLNKSKWEQHATEVQVRTALAMAHSALTTAVQQKHAYEREILPGARSAFQAIEEGYRRGTFDYMDFLSAQRDLAGTRVKYVDALVSLHAARAAVERLTGEPISEVTLSPGTSEEIQR